MLAKQFDFKQIKPKQIKIDNSMNWQVIFGTFEALEQRRHTACYLLIAINMNYVRLKQFRVVVVTMNFL